MVQVSGPERGRRPAAGLRLLSRGSRDGGTGHGRLCLRHGWVGSWKRRNENEPYIYGAAKQLERVIKARMKRLLDLPYGAAAEKLKLHKGGAPPPVLVDDIDW